MDDLLFSALQAVLADHCTPAAVRAIEAGGSPSALWQQIECSGFADALVPEVQGGAGLGLAEIFPLMELCGTHAVPVPLAETQLARALLAQAGVSRPPGSVALARGHLAQDGSLVCASVQGGRVASHVLVVLGARPLLLDAATATVRPAGFVLDAGLRWSPPAMAAALPLDGLGVVPDVQLLLGCINAVQLAGALRAVLSQTLQYANDREQFGRSIGKFQAIQQQLSVMAEHTFAARMAAQIGCQGAALRPDRLRVAVAKARTSEAALEVAALGHSIHGAIGVTREFDLQLHTRRLHAWRQAGGSESYWHNVAGAALVDQHQRLTLDLIRCVTDLPGV